MILDDIILNMKTKFFGIGALALVIVFLILSVDVNADFHLATGVSVLDIYEDQVTNLTINIFNSTNLYNCTTNAHGYCELGIGNFSINFTYCNNSYHFSVSINDYGEVENLTMNLSSACQIPNSCNANENCSNNQNCYNGYCKNLNCNAGYAAKNHHCEFAVGCKIGGIVSAKVGAKVGSKYSVQNVSEISNCTTLNKGDKTYILTQDINASENTCINISADNTVLDCRWHKISGNINSIGINIQGNNALIENCIIENFSNGIWIESNSTTIYCNMIQNNNRGIGNTNNEINNSIYKNLIRYNEIGIRNGIGREKNISIEANEIIKNNIGIYGYEITSNNSPDLSNNIICSNNINVNFTNYTNIGNCTLPDLAITEIHVPLISDGNLTINVTSENLFQNLYNGSAMVSIIINEYIVQNQTIATNLTPKSILSFNFSLPSGIYFVTASIFPTSEINESTELNNVLSNAFVVIKENQSIIYGKTEHSGRLLPNINLTLTKYNGEILNLSSDENGFFEIVLDEGTYTLKSIYSNEVILNVSKNSIISDENISINLITLNVADINNLSLENAKVVIIDTNTNKSVVLFTNENGIVEFIPSNGHTYKIFMFKEGYTSYKLIINQTNYTFDNSVHIFTEECIEIQDNTSFFENYSIKIYSDLQNKIRQNKIERVISYSVNKKNMSIIPPSVPSMIGSKVGALIGAKARCYVNITNIPENLTVNVIENVSVNVTEKPANSSFNGIKIAKIVERIGNKTIPLGEVNINFTYKSPNFGNVIAKSGEVGEQNLSYTILHLDANETNKIGEKILYLPVKNDKGIVCVNDNATNLSDINNMIENDCDGNWRIMNESDTVTFGNITYYKVLSNGTGAVGLNFVWGDANKNNMLDLEDAFKIIEHTVTSSPIPARANINNDEAIDIFDVVEILEGLSQ